jgi:mercuric ion transport protein
MRVEPKPQASPQAAAQNRLGLGLIGIAVGSTLLASTCCVLPLVLVLVGIGGAWMVNLTALKPYTAPFVVIALIALAWAGYLVFRSMPACPAEGTSCDDGAQRTTRKIFIVCAIFIAVLLLFPFAAPLFY